MIRNAKWFSNRSSINKHLLLQPRLRGFFMPAAMTNTTTFRFPTWLGFGQGAVLYALYKSHHDKL